MNKQQNGNLVVIQYVGRKDSSVELGRHRVPEIIKHLSEKGCKVTYKEKTIDKKFQTILFSFHNESRSEAELIKLLDYAVFVQTSCRAYEIKIVETVAAKPMLSQLRGVYSNNI